MPELPEVETVANGVDARVRGERIAAAWFSDKPEPMKTNPAVMEQVLTGAVITRVHRVGKTVVMDLERRGTRGKEAKAKAGPTARAKSKTKAGPSASPQDDKSCGVSAQFLVHLGMTGRLLVNDGDVPRAKHTHAVLSLASGRELRFVDPRRFGRLSVQEGYEGPGREPLTIGPEEFAALFRGRRTPMKSALLNQKLLHGVGNIYADEALFRAGVRPRRQAARVTRAELERLRTGLVKVLRLAIALGGSSVSDYVDADGVRGFFQVEHRVYQRTGEACRECGEPIRRVVIAGRSSHYCGRCQT
jgi:formamidopyrimidine-DNA glycosylase